MTTRTKVIVFGVPFLAMLAVTSCSVAAMHRAQTA